MSRINLDNIKTYHQYDLSDNYESLAKFGRHFEKGFHESQINQLPIDLDSIKSLLICSDGASRHIADFSASLTPFFLKVPFEISTSFRLPNYVNKNTFVLLFSENPSSEEITSTKRELDTKESSHLTFEYQNLPHSLGYIFGLFTRLNPSYSKTIIMEELFLQIEKTVSKINRDLDEANNPAKQLAQKHSQKAIILLSSGHLQGVASFTTGLITRWAKTFSIPLILPEANAYIENLFTYPTKVLGDYQVLVLNSDMYPQSIIAQVERAKQTLSQKRVNFSVIKPDSSDWFSQILESLVFLCFFSYYLSIVNKSK